eukprot:2967185-Rhodomonas_salina.2
MKAWTDGSRQLLPTEPEEGGKALFVGAGAVSNIPQLTFEFQVRGELVVIRGEMGVTTEVVVRADRTMSLTVFTDCMTLLQIALLDSMAAGAQTLLVWVKAHVWDIGNEGADQAADRGCKLEDICFEQPTYQFRIYNIHTDDTISMHGWANKATTHAREEAGSHTLAQLQRAATPGNIMCTLAGEGQEILGAVLQSDKVTQEEVRNLLQCRGATYPTATIVKWNRHGATREQCPLCRKTSHMLMHCEVTKQASLRAHYSIADPLVHSIAEAAPGEWAVWTLPVVWKIPKPRGYPPPTTNSSQSQQGHCPTDIPHDAMGPDAVGTGSQQGYLPGRHCPVHTGLPPLAQPRQEGSDLQILEVHGHQGCQNGGTTHPESTSIPGAAAIVPTAPTTRPQCGTVHVVCHEHHWLSAGQESGGLPPRGRKRCPGTIRVPPRLGVRLALAPHSFPLDDTSPLDPSGSAGS